MEVDRGRELGRIRGGTSKRDLGDGKGRRVMGVLKGWKSGKRGGGGELPSNA